MGENATDSRTAAGASAQGLGSGSGLNTDAGQATPLADPQIVSVLSNINAGAIERGTIALESAQAATVRALAQELIDTRLAGQERLTRLVAATSFSEAVHVTNAENAVSHALQERSKDIVARLQATAGARFDALFLRAELDVFSTTLQVIDERLLPSVQNVLVRAEIDRVRAETIVLSQRTRALQAVLGEPDDADGGVSDVDAGF